MTPRRPLLRWHGGKWKIAPKILPYLPPHRVYVEPYGGAAGILLRKAPSYAEVYNDLDKTVVNLFRVLRDPAQADRLVELLRLTPFAREEFDAAYEISDDPVEEARRLIIRSFMGFGSDAPNRDVYTGFRANSNRSGTTPARDWCRYPETLGLTIDRLRGVIIENRPAIDVMAQHDADTTLHYVDPPYMPETRSSKAKRGGDKFRSYAHELSDEDHEALLAALRDLDGMVVLSGYASALYDETLQDWHRVELATHADGAQPRIEVLWINPAAWRRLDQPALL